MAARTTNRYRFFAPQATRGERLRYGGDLAWFLGPAALKFEYDVQTNERDAWGQVGAILMTSPPPAGTPPPLMS
jgi:hypothetical protein